MISVNSYVSQEAFDAGKGYLKQEMEQFVPSAEDNSPNFIRQGCDYIKTLDNRKDAIDC